MSVDTIIVSPLMEFSKRSKFNNSKIKLFIDIIKKA